jgi:hypothetical protein
MPSCFVCLLLPPSAQATPVACAQLLVVTALAYFYFLTTGPKVGEEKTGNSPTLCGATRELRSRIWTPTRPPAQLVLCAVRGGHLTSQNATGLSPPTAGIKFCPAQPCSESRRCHLKRSTRFHTPDHNLKRLTASAPKSTRFRKQKYWPCFPDPNDYQQPHFSLPRQMSFQPTPNGATCLAKTTNPPRAFAAQYHKQPTEPKNDGQLTTDD